MSTKKYKPALIELVSKGTLKPRKGILGTPKWFYSGKSVEKPAAETPAKTTPPPAKPVPITKPEVFPTGKTGPDIATNTALHVPADRKWQFGSEKTAESPAILPGKKLQLNLSYWVIALVCLALFLSLLLMFRLGQRNRTPSPAPSAESAENTADTPASSSLEAIQNSQVRPDLIPDRSSAGIDVQPRPPLSTILDTSLPAPVEEAKTPTPPVAAAAETEAGMCLQICYNPNRRDLLPVQEHFNKQGIDTLIGQVGNVYILYSKQTFDKKNSEECLALKEKIKKTGANYNREKPASAVSYNPETFASAFPINVKDIIK